MGLINENVKYCSKCGRSLTHHLEPVVFDEKFKGITTYEKEGYHLLPICAECAIKQYKAKLNSK